MKSKHELLSKRGRQDALPQLLGDQRINSDWLLT
jgi:hypothetical protein